MFKCFQVPIQKSFLYDYISHISYIHIYHIYIIDHESSKALKNKDFYFKMTYVQGFINIGSVNGDSLLYKELSAYAASKAAVIHRTKSLVTELSRYKIRIKTINPGSVQSDFQGSPNKHDSNFWKDKIPAGFIAKLRDLDEAILYLASNNAMLQAHA